MPPVNFTPIFTYLFVNILLYLKIYKSGTFLLKKHTTLYTN